jgi:hypothetical protein
MRPDFQIYLHVLGATALFGSTVCLVVLAAASRSRAEPRPLAFGAFATILAVAIPAWLLTLVFGSWTKSKEGWPSGLAWLDLGQGIADAGLLVLLVSAGLSFAWLRRPATAWLPAALGLLAAGYTVALGVAWWVMTTKVPS